MNSSRGGMQYRCAARVAVSVRPALLIALCCWLSPAVLNAQAGTYGVRGRVVDRSGNTAIAQATVTLGDNLRTVSDRNGEFEFRGVRPEQVEVIADRSRSVGYALRILGRDDIMDSKAPTPIEYLKGRGVPIRDCPGMTGKLCIGLGAAIWIDEIPSCLEALAIFPNESIERIEVIGSQRATIRAYTRWFVERMTERKIALQPITPFDKPFAC